MHTGVSSLGCQAYTMYHVLNAACLRIWLTQFTEWHLTLQPNYTILSGKVHNLTCTAWCLLVICTFFMNEIANKTWWEFWSVRYYSWSWRNIFQYFISTNGQNALKLQGIKSLVGCKQQSDRNVAIWCCTPAVQFQVKWRELFLDLKGASNTDSPLFVSLVSVSMSSRVNQ